MILNFMNIIKTYEFMPSTVYHLFHGLHTVNLACSCFYCVLCQFILNVLLLLYNALNFRILAVLKY